MIIDIRRRATLRISNWLDIRSKLRGWGRESWGGEEGGQLAFYKIVEN